MDFPVHAMILSHRTASEDSTHERELFVSRLPSTSPPGSFDQIPFKVTERKASLRVVIIGFLIVPYSDHDR